MSYFPSWRPATGAVVMPDERLPAAASLTLGLQHLLAMSGSTIVAPILMGFDPNVAVFFSGIGTLLFFVLTAGRVPSYLGSSFAFIAVVLAVMGQEGATIGHALGGIIMCGALYALIGLIVMIVGHAWVEKLMPPVVTGTIGMAIGLNLAPVAVQQLNAFGNPTWSHTVVALATVLAMALISCYGSSSLRRVSVLLAMVIGYALVIVFGNVLGLMAAIDFGPVAQAAWFGMPNFTAPEFHLPAMTLIAPVAIVLVAENLGHIKALGSITGQNMDRYIGRGFVADGVATMVAGSGGGTGVTTYAENIGVMAMTKVYSTLIFVIAAVVAIVLGLSPKFGAVLQTIPAPVMAGLSVAVFGLIASAMARIWIDNKVDFSDSRNLFTAGIALIFGAGDFTLTFGGFALGGIGTSTLAALVLYQVLSIGRKA